MAKNGVEAMSLVLDDEEIMREEPVETVLQEEPKPIKNQLKSKKQLKMSL